MPEEMPTIVAERGTAIAAFVLDLAQEGERSAVVLGASRADTALDELLKRFLRPNPGGTDNLFDADRALGTLSAKIALAFRLGLIDRSCEHALQMLRKIRNDFAHSIGRATLAEPRHKARLQELVADAKKVGESYEAVFDRLAPITNPDLRAFCAATGLIISVIDFAVYFVQPVAPSLIVRLDRGKAESA